MIRAMRVVAGQAVFFYRRMFPDERTALFGVAARAELNHRFAVHHGVRERAVGVMAVGALDPSLDDGMVRGFQQLRADLLMAGGAGFVLQLARSCFVRAHRRIGLVQREARARPGRAMQAVAVITGDVVLLVLAGIPEREVAVTLMTGQADRGFSLGGNGFVVESQDSADTAAAAGFCVLQGVDVAGLAVRTPYIAFLPVFRGFVTFDVGRVTGFADF